MTEFNYERVATYAEWQAVCSTWNKPNSPPSKKMSSLTDGDMNRKVIVCYPDNVDANERDIVLVKRVGASTPDFLEDYWVSGANSFLDKEFG
jgi:hypothetical protein